MQPNPFIQYLIERFVEAIEEPEDTRKQRKIKRKEERPPLLFRWFGLLPTAIKVTFQKQKRRLRRTT
ncbi:YqzE family protein [Thalassorhabdus alkalitolerans]|uniref:YqzE family protein n=1 Tax=Thalassorhabdus alkalitolerans TaxID=2282697 RepID=A0ABW0YQE0_9BACI|nr:MULTISPECIES: YqzE family protein [Bacillaceae]